MEQVFKVFIRPRIEYVDVIFNSINWFNDQHDPLNVTSSNLMDKLESVQYKAALAITGTWKGTSKIYYILGWEYLCHRRWVKQMRLFFKIVKGIAPDYLRSELQSMNLHRN